MQKAVCPTACILFQGPLSSNPPRSVIEAVLLIFKTVVAQDRWGLLASKKLLGFEGSGCFTV